MLIHKLLQLLAVMLFSLTLVACGGGSSSPAPAPVQEAPEEEAPPPTKTRRERAQRTAAPAPSPPAPPVQREASPSRQPDPAPSTPSVIAPVVEAAPDPPPVESTGLINISSWPKSRVFVNDVYIQDSPLSRHQLPPGEHVIRLQAEDGRLHQFTVDVFEDSQISKIWHFDSSSWLE